MKKEEITFIHRVNHLILNTFPQTISSLELKTMLREPNCQFNCVLKTYQNNSSNAT